MAWVETWNRAEVSRRWTPEYIVALYVGHFILEGNWCETLRSAGTCVISTMHSTRKTDSATVQWNLSHRILRPSLAYWFVWKYGEQQFIRLRVVCSVEHHYKVWINLTCSSIELSILFNNQFLLVQCDQWTRKHSLCFSQTSVEGSL